MHFTGKERDSESGLDNFGARYDSSQYGRFMTPDPAGMAAADLTNPQSWNQYAYVMNNPATLTDPTGLDPWDELGGGWGGGGWGGGNVWSELPPMAPPMIPNWSGIPLPGPGSGGPTSIGINDPWGFPGQSSGSGCPYGSGSCGGMIYGWTTDASGNVIGSYPWETLCEQHPDGSCIMVVWDPKLKIWDLPPQTDPRRRSHTKPGATPESPRGCSSTTALADTAESLAVISAFTGQEEISLAFEAASIYYRSRTAVMGCAP
jgi:RHS repeat-associated protein